jgi:hypothetical protein
LTNKTGLSMMLEIIRGRSSGQEVRLSDIAQ